jgi:hypothetical protein
MKHPTTRPQWLSMRAEDFTTGQASLFDRPPAAAPPLGTPGSLFSEAAAARNLTDRLAAGESVPGGPGACHRCGHAKVWHNLRNRTRECEQCQCARYEESAR